jgi:peptidoglycan/LPS O-acetylase OafA/YrhL
MMQSVSGLITMGYFIAGLSVPRFWSRTRDGLFAAFAVAFWLLATNQGLVAIAGVPREEQTWFYLLRLVAFLLIIGAVVAKNRRSRSV